MRTNKRVNTKRADRATRPPKKQRGPSDAHASTRPETGEASHEPVATHYENDPT